MVLNMPDRLPHLLDLPDVYLSLGILFAKRSGDHRDGRMSVSSLFSRREHAEITEYNEDTQCTICNATVLDDRYKCVSCTKFDLCKSCTSALIRRAMLTCQVTTKSKTFILRMLSFLFPMSCYLLSGLHSMPISAMGVLLLRVVSSCGRSLERGPS